MELRPGGERLACEPITYQLHYCEKPISAAHIAHDGVPPLHGLELPEHRSAKLARALDEVLFEVALERRHPRSAAQGMPAVGESRKEHLRLDEPCNAGRQHHGAERQVCAGESLRQGHEIGPRVLRTIALPGEPFAAAAE